MNNCTNCLANNSYKKIIKDGSILYVCEYCNTVKEDTKEDIVNKTPSSVTELVSEAEEVPKYNEKNVATANFLIGITFIFCLLVFIASVSAPFQKLIFKVDRYVTVIFESDEAKADRTITPDEYKKIEIGMSIDDVKKIAGYHPNIVIVYEEYKYIGQNGVKEDAYVSLEFSDDKLISIYEYGLLEEE
ncbi:hypothetical protein ACQKII_23635 [Lysinibacillus sp. NPDC048646]|uniref:hypothetical protein n=1 Tax=Lysinibacillus sp. NPDC048646 TaxID=3390574 RepID=UPI003D06D250